MRSLQAHLFAGWRCRLLIALQVAAKKEQVTLIHLAGTKVKRLSYLLLSVASIYTRFSTFPVHGISTKDEKANYAAVRTFEEETTCKGSRGESQSSKGITMGIYIR